jgi:hypothetical protein
MNRTKKLKQIALFSFYTSLIAALIAVYLSGMPLAGGSLFLASNI